MAQVTVKFTKLRIDDLPPPRYETPGSAGMDLRASIEAPLTIEPGHHAAVPTGIAIELPQGYEGQVRPRSGLAARHGITVLNAPGTIDSDYRGEIKVLLINLGLQPVQIAKGDRIAQLIVAPVVQAILALADSLPDTDRGAGGFGHTGLT